MTDITDPVSSATIFKNVRQESAPAYASPDAAYNAWCAALGVDNSTTDYTVSGSNRNLDWVDVGFPPIIGSTNTYVMISQGGPLMLFRQTPTVPGTSTYYTTSWGNPTLDVWGSFVLPGSTPVLMLGGRETPGSNRQNYNLKLKKGMLLARKRQEVIMIWTQADTAGSTSNPLRIAIRLTPGYFECYVEALSTLANPPVMLYTVNNENTNTWDTSQGAAVASSFGTSRVAMITDDLGYLQPTLLETLNVAQAAIISSKFGLSAAEGLKLGSKFGFGFGYHLTQNLQLMSTPAYKWVAGAAISEIIKLHPALGPNIKSSITLAELLQIAAQISKGIPVTMLQGLTIGQTVHIVLGVLLAQKLYIKPHFDVNEKFGAALADGLRFNAALAQFLNLSLDEELTLSSLATYNYQAVTVLSDNLLLNSLLGNTLAFNITCAETIKVTDAQLLHMIFSGSLSDEMLLTALYVSPQGNYTTWAINTRTNAITQYDNWQFNSFAAMGRKYLAADRNGLYELNGEQDDGHVNVNATLQTGMLQLAGTKLAGLKGLYLGMKVSQGNNQFFIKMTAGDGREYVYQIKAQPNLMTTKVNIGKGLRSRYFSFTLESTGPDFNLDTVEFVPMIGQRRV